MGVWKEEEVEGEDEEKLKEKRQPYMIYESCIKQRWIVDEGRIKYNRSHIAKC